MAGNDDKVKVVAMLPMVFRAPAGLFGWLSAWGKCRENSERPSFKGISGESLEAITDAERCQSYRAVCRQED